MAKYSGEELRFLRSAKKVPAITWLAEKILDRGYDALLELVAQRAPEDLHIEFKKKSEPSKDEWRKDDLSNFGKTLSGFSNAEGGLVIWGVHTEKSESIDVASELRPLKEVLSLHGKLKSLISSYTSPSNEDIATYVVHDPSNNSNGFIFICIPKGQNRPYMSTASNARHYYRKTVDSIRSLDHYEIVDLMRAELTPQLSLTSNLTLTETNGYGDKQFDLLVMVKNVGNVSCKQPYLWVEPPLNFFSFAPSNLVTLKDTRGTDKKIKFFTPPSYTLFPEDFFNCFSIHFTVLAEQLGPLKCSWGRNRSGNSDKIRSQICDTDIEMWSGSEGSPKTQFTFNISEKQITATALSLCGY